MPLLSTVASILNYAIMFFSVLGNFLLTGYLTLHLCSKTVMSNLNAREVAQVFSVLFPMILLHSKN